MPLESRLANERIDFRFNLINALLYLMSHKGQLALPSMHEYITKEILEGLSQVSLKQPFPYPRSHRDPFSNWEEKYNEALNDILRKDEKMVELISESMDKILRFRHVYVPSPGDSYYVNEIRKWMCMPYWNAFKSKFVISIDHAKSAEEFLGQLFSTTREWLEQVAEHASKATELDLAYIQEHYHW